MAITHGSKAKISIGGPATGAPPIDTAPEWLTCDCFTDATWNRQKAEVETTTNKDGLDDSFIPGHRNRTFDVALAYDPANEAQEAILDNFDADEELVWVRYRAQGDGAGLPQEVFKAFVTNCPVTSPGKDKTTMQVTMRVSGKPVSTVQGA